MGENKLGAAQEINSQETYQVQAEGERPGLRCHVLECDPRGTAGPEMPFDS